MAARGNEVARAIEAQVREAIEKMVGDIRSSVDDVREAVNQQLEAVLQSVQADANAISFRPSLEKTLTEFESSVESVAPAPAPAAAAPAAPDARRVKRAIQGVERGKSQVEVLNALLDQMLHFGSRAALLILKGDAFAGWKGAGFGAFGGNDEQIKRFTANAGQVVELDEAVRNERVLRFDGASLASKFGVTPAQDAILVPMVIKDKIAAVMYVDTMEGEESKFDAASIELLVFTTGLLIDTLAIRKKIPSPSLSADEGGDAAAAPVPAAPAPKPVPAAPPPPPKPAPPAAAPASVPPQTSGGTVAIPNLSLRDIEAAATPARRPAPPPSEFATTAMPALSMEAATAAAAKPAPPPPAPAPPTPAPAAAPAGASSFGAEADRPSTQYIPPAGMQRGGANSGEKSDEAKKHDEARRFARLLVSEIKLYNESKVEQGRKNKDLYERMKEDIDRSRQMYDERIGEEVRKASNYFYDELVRILADGDAESLGL